MNGTDRSQVYYDQWMYPHILEPGESKMLDVGNGASAGNVVKSDPPSGMIPVTNLYIDPETGRVSVEFDD